MQTIDAFELETTTLKILDGLRAVEWVPFTMGNMRTRLRETNEPLGNASDLEMVDCIRALEEDGYIEVQKFVDLQAVPFNRSQATQSHYRVQFFGIGDFQLRITHKGRKSLAERMRVAIPSPVASLATRELDDLLPIFRLKTFKADLEEFSSAAVTKNTPLAMIRLDVNNFKRYNEEFDHGVGDDVLKEVARLIRRWAEPQGYAYRLGGDEMALLIPNCTKGDAQKLAESIQNEMAKTKFTDRKLDVSVSLGIATIPDDAKSANELSQLADSKEREAKRARRSVSQATNTNTSAANQPLPAAQSGTGNLTPEQARDIRTAHFRGQAVECPFDQALLTVHRINEMGSPTPTLFVKCPMCGLQDFLTGV
jgi:diguanylate cyclase (GGDEF)-like protein